MVEMVIPDKTSSEVFAPESGKIVALSGQLYDTGDTRNGEQLVFLEGKLSLSEVTVSHHRAINSSLSRTLMQAFFRYNHRHPGGLDSAHLEMTAEFAFEVLLMRSKVQDLT